MSATVAAGQRFNRHHPCPICGGHSQLPPGRGERCYGFLSSDREYAHCVREEYAGDLVAGRDGAFAHKLTGRCRCGRSHDGTPDPTMSRNGHKPDDPPPRPMGPARRWLIAEIDGDRIEHVRQNLDNGGKQMWWTTNGQKGLFGRHPIDFPFYGIDGINGDVKGTVIVEGEPARDALSPLADEIDLVVLGTTTGAKTCPSDDILRTVPPGPVVLWGDADSDGEQHMLMIAEGMERIGRRDDVHRMVWPEARPDSGDDAADFVEQGATVTDLKRLDTPAFFEEKVSDRYKTGVWSERKLKFHSAREIAEMTPERPPWIAVPWLVAGGITELDGKIKASGKTTFATHMCRAILDG